MVNRPVEEEMLALLHQNTTKRHEWSFGLTILPYSLLQIDEVRVVLVRLHTGSVALWLFSVFAQRQLQPVVTLHSQSSDQSTS